VHLNHHLKRRASPETASPADSPGGGSILGRHGQAGAPVSGRALATKGAGWRFDGRSAAVLTTTFIACVAVGAGVSLGLPETLDEKGALVGAFVVCAIAGLGPIVLLGRGALREPVVYYPVVAFASLAASSLAWLGDPRSDVSLARADITKALLLVAAGFASLWAGWFATRAKRARRPRSGFSVACLPSRSLTIALAAVGLFSLMVLVATGSFGYARDFDVGGPLGPWTEWLVASRSALDIALVFAALRVFARLDRVQARPDWILFIALLILQFASGLVSASKVGFVLPKLLAVVFIYALFHDRLPIKWISLFLIAIISSFLIVDQVRALSAQAGTETDAVALLVEGIRETTEDLNGSSASALDRFKRRTREIENVAVVLRDTPRVLPHTNGDELPEAFAVALVPRVLWPGKPVFDVERRFPQLYLKQAPDSRSATGPSHFGDFYRNFGLLGVVLGMGLFGALFALLGRFSETGGVRTLFIIAFAFTVLTRSEDSLAGGIVAFARIMPPVILAALLIPSGRSLATGARGRPAFIVRPKPNRLTGSGPA
jgi:hypothetical protein